MVNDHIPPTVTPDLSWLVAAPGLGGWVTKPRLGPPDLSQADLDAIAEDVRFERTQDANN
jgi:hypothetical protein